MSREYIPYNAANDRALAYWTDQTNFPVYKEPRTRIQKLIDPQTRKERRRAKRFAGLLGAIAVMNLMPSPELEIYNGN